MLDRDPRGSTDLILYYLAEGEAATATDGNGVPLIKWCAYYGDVSGFLIPARQRRLLKSLGENLDLNGAVFHGHWQLCEFLIEHGADVNHRLPDTGETPLHAALCKANRPAYNRVLKVLLANGANPNCATTPNVETDGFMRDCRTKGETPLHRAAAFGTEEAVQLLLDAGAIVDAKDTHMGILHGPAGTLASRIRSQKAVLRRVQDSSSEQLDLRPWDGLVTKTSLGSTLMAASLRSDRLDSELKLPTGN